MIINNEILSFVKNIATEGGGLYLSVTNGYPKVHTIKNTIFSSNHGKYGGGAYIYGTASPSLVVLQATQYFGNTGELYGGGIFINRRVDITILESFFLICV